MTDFRQRGLRMTRIETFTDAAFAFAVTMLVVVHGSLPTDHAELVAAMQQVPAFVASVAMIGMFWYGHHTWSRRFGLEDGITIVLSFLLVLTMLVYVYPLRAMFSSMFHWLSGQRLPAGIRIETTSELADLFVIYGSGFVVMCLCLVLLNLHALRKRLDVPLNALERFDTRAEIIAWCLVMGAGFASIALALASTGMWVVGAGFVYAALAVVMPAYGVWMSRRRHGLERG